MSPLELETRPIESPPDESDGCHILVRGSTTKAICGATVSGRAIHNLSDCMNGNHKMCEACKTADRMRV